MTAVGAWTRVRAWTVAAAFGATLAGCATGQQAPNVSYSPEGHLLTSAWDADRLDAIYEAQRQAQRYCWNYENHRKMRLLKQSTTYHGRLNEQITGATEVAGRIGTVLGKPDVDLPHQMIASENDYESTAEFQCQ